MPRAVALATIALAVTLTSACNKVSRTADAIGETAELVVTGDTKDLYERPANAPPRSPDHHELLVIALDGVGRDLLYDAIRAGMMPELTALLGGREFEHAYFEEELLTMLPSSTMPSWVAAFTGEPPAENGVPGNEFFLRDDERFVAPTPTSFGDIAVVLSNYTDAYLSNLIEVPTVYQRMRARDPSVLVWVTMSPIYRGADELHVTSRAALATAARAMIADFLDEEDGLEVFAAVDREVMAELLAELERQEFIPDVLTVYLSGTDGFAHVSKVGPDSARQRYLAEVVDPLIGDLRRELASRRELADRAILVTTDHGHTAVVSHDDHALDDGDDDPPGLLEAAGFRPRAAQIDVGDDGFDAVLAYQGAMAFLYLADRSTCDDDGHCDWRRPARRDEDVLVAARAFAAASRDGALCAAMKDTIDLVLVRDPDRKGFLVVDADGRTTPLRAHLAAEPRENYLRTADRLDMLIDGPHADRAGDVILIAHNGGREKLEERYYFAHPYRSLHGSPGERDSRISLIVAHPGASRAELAGLTGRVLGDRPTIERVADLMLALRYQDY